MKRYRVKTDFGGFSVVVFIKFYVQSENTTWNWKVPFQWIGLKLDREINIDINRLEFNSFKNYMW